MLLRPIDAPETPYRGGKSRTTCLRRIRPNARQIQQCFSQIVGIPSCGRFGANFHQNASGSCLVSIKWCNKLFWNHFGTTDWCQNKYRPNEPPTAGLVLVNSGRLWYELDLKTKLKPSFARAKWGESGHFGPIQKLLCAIARMRMSSHRFQILLGSVHGNPSIEWCDVEHVAPRQLNGGFPWTDHNKI